MDLIFGGSGGPTTSDSLATASSPINDLSASASGAAAAAAAAAAVVASLARTTTPTTTTTTSATTATAAFTTHTASVHHHHHNHHFNGHDNGPILYDNLNRTSAIDDIRSVVIYIFIITIFVSFFLILPGIRSEKLPTFLCITTSLLVTSIIIIGLNGTTWHVGEAPISAPYKAFSRDRIQGDLGVRMGLQSVNISLRAHKYYILHATNGPMIMENTHTFSLLPQPLMMMLMAPTEKPPPQDQPALPAEGQPRDDMATGSSVQSTSVANATFMRQEESTIHQDRTKHHQSSANDDDVNNNNNNNNNNNFAEELLTGRTSDGGIVDTELEVDEPFSSQVASQQQQRPASDQQDVLVLSSRRIIRASNSNNSPAKTSRARRQTTETARHSANPNSQRYNIKRVHVDINYNERFYWIGPMQMRHEYQQALQRGLPYPILTVVEYLSQDDAGFNWSRQYRAAGYYTSMLLWFSACVCVLMFCLHCAAPKYGIYTMQLLGLLLLLTNLTYATLVPRGDQKLVIPFEGQSVTFRFGWNFWLVLVGGCLSLLVGSIIVIIDKLFPNFIFTTVLDVDFDSSSQSYYQRKHKIFGRKSRQGVGGGDDDNDDHDQEEDNGQKRIMHEKPKIPPFMRVPKKPRVKKTKKRQELSSSVALDDITPSDVARKGGQSALRTKLVLMQAPNTPSICENNKYSTTTTNTTTSSQDSNLSRKGDSAKTDENSWNEPTHQ